MTVRNIVFVLIGIFLLVDLVILFFVFLLLNLNVWRGIRRTNVKTANLFKVLEVDPLRNTSTFGVMSRFEELEPEQFVTYVDENDHYVLISTFETEEYYCFGTCTCLDERRNSITKTSSNLVFYLVAAVSTAIAYTHAKELFEEDCVDQLGDSCPAHSIISSEVSDCQKATSGTSEGEEKVKNVNRKDVPFWCEGRCILNYYREGEYERLRFQMWENQEEGKEEMEGVDEKRLNRLINQKKKCEDYLLQKTILVDVVDEYGRVDAEVKFKEELDTYCNENADPEVCLDEGKTDYCAEVLENDVRPQFPFPDPPKKKRVYKKKAVKIENVKK